MQIKEKNNENGSILAIVLIVVMLIGISMASYLKLVANQNLSIQRSQNWNHALAVAEAGIEEAMAQLNKNTTQRLKDKWTLEITNVVKSRVLDSNTKFKAYVT